MRLTTFSSHLPRNCISTFALIALVGGTQFTTAQDNELGRIAARVQALKKIVDDKYVSEEKLGEVGDELKDMFDRTNELSRGLAEQNISKPIIALQGQILPMLAFIRERLPEESTRDKPVFRRAPRAGIGVPAFDSGKLIGRLAGETSKAHYRLSRHLTKPSPDKATTNELVVEMILAEEALAWEVGWPFTDGEVAKLKAAGDKLTEEVYLSRRDRGLKRINKRIDADHATVGRTPPPPFVMHRANDLAVQSEVEKRLKELRGTLISAEVGTTLFDEHEQLVLLGKKARQREETEADTKDTRSTDTPKETKFDPEPSLDELLRPTPKPKVGSRPAPKFKAETRLWTDTSGKFRVQAVFVNLIGGTVRLKREDNGETVELKLSELSKTDRQYVEGLK